MLESQSVSTHFFILDRMMWWIWQIINQLLAVIVILVVAAVLNWAHIIM